MTKQPKMVSMEMDDDEKLDTMMPMEAPERPDYPWGLRINLSEKELDKLNLDETEAEQGGTVHGHFIGKITSVSREERDGRKTCRVEIQIEDLAIESEDEENADQEAAENDAPAKTTRRKSVLYG